MWNLAKLSIVSAAAFVGLASSASAMTMVEIGTSTDGGATFVQQVFDNTSPFFLNFVGAVGGFETSTTATGQPPNFAPSLLLANSIDISSNASAGSPADVWIYVTAVGVDDPVGSVIFLSSFTANATFPPAADNVPAGWGVELSTWVDTSNSGGGVLGTLIASQCWGTAICGPAVSTTINVGAGPYAVTNLFKLHATAPGGANLTINLAAIPVPAALPLLLSGLAGLGVIGSRKTRRKNVDKIAA